MSKYNRRIEFIHKVKVGTNDYNEDIYDWRTYKFAMAAIRPISDREFFAAEKVHSEVTHRIETRYRTDIDTAMRIKYRGREFEILSLCHPYESRKETHFRAKELLLTKEPPEDDEEGGE